MSRNKSKLLAANAADVVEAVREGSSAAIEKTGPYLEKANALLHAGAEAAAPKLREAGSRLQHAAESARDQFDAHYGDQIENAKVELTKRGRKVFAQSGDQLTRASKLIATAETPSALDDLATRITGDKKAVKKVQKALAERSADLAKAAKKEAKRQAKAARRGPGLLTWILILGALGAIGYFVYKALKPVEDPWSTPLPGNRPADARPVGSTPASEAEGASAAAAPVVSEVPAPDESGELVESDSSDEDEDAEAAEDAEDAEK